MDPSIVLNRCIAVAATILITIGLYQLNQATAGLAIERKLVGETPLTVYRRGGAPGGPTVVIAHGFAGSQQLMQPFAIELAKNGFTAVTFDFLGHGRHPSPLTGDITQESGATRALVAQTIEVANFAKTIAGDAGALALVGHSMASDIVVRAAAQFPEAKATVAVSMFSPAVSPSVPKNLLVIVGALEPEVLKSEARRAVAMVSNGPPQERTTYGDVTAGSARRFVLAEGVEHISVLYSRSAMSEAIAWLNQSLARAAEARNTEIDNRGAWIAILLLGLIALARPLAHYLPVAAPAPAGAGLAWREFLVIAIAPAILTPLILWRAPTDFLPMLVADYLAVHFAVYGVLTALGLWFWRMRKSDGNAPQQNTLAIAVAAAAIAAYSLGAIGLALDAYVVNFMPAPQRLPLIAAMFAGTLPYFLADEWLTRGRNAPRAAYAITKVCFLASLAIAVALNLEKLFFLIIIVPAILIFFVVFGLFSGWAYRRVQSPLAGAFANSIIFAWALAVTFPVLAQ